MYIIYIVLKYLLIKIYLLLKSRNDIFYAKTKLN